PTKSATRIESSRYYTKQLMEKLKIPTTKYVVFNDREQALKFVSEIEKFPVTIKIDSLQKNMGIFIARSNKMATDIVNQ
ncbi:phosphoribosylamine--glycine ligase, partial [Parvimonas micra]|nr:phosphoribosylamine--glycine ligase [Parvimonas micra]